MLAGWLSPYRGCCSAPVWSRVLVLVAGAVLAPGKRTVSQALRVATHLQCLLEGHTTLEGRPSDVTTEQVEAAYFGATGHQGEGGEA